MSLMFTENKNCKTSRQKHRVQR